MSKQRIKQLLPATLLVWATKARMLLQPNEHERRSRTLWSKLGRIERVLSGPFAGMTYIGAARGSSLVTKLLGTYEMELHPVFGSLPAWQPDAVIDIGAAEGYYAVGLARLLPAAKVIPFDIDPFAVHLMRKLARANGVEQRLDVRAACTPATLEATAAAFARPLVISDCEGYEDVVLDPAAAPSLRKAMVIVELHEFVAPGVSDRIRARFEPTHDIEIIHTRPRTAADIPAEARSLPHEITPDDLNEYRPGPMTWFAMRPRGTN
jgi:hypothetical protein